ncbi:hypothetical protein [Cupriavidus basilensis]|uniref:hypothetical protein n=1 Tax=Cupriavidus basilensis TaxID=68895 RepID=UPI0023E76C27|nr:hypothetical protein [Cupriavidus basilensis]
MKLSLTPLAPAASSCLKFWAFRAALTSTEKSEALVMGAFMKNPCERKDFMSKAACSQENLANAWFFVDFKECRPKTV